MTPGDVLESCRRGFVLVSRLGELIELEALFPESHPMTARLVEDVRRHKPELLVWLAWEERADRLLLESTRRLGAAWPEGCPLDDPEWERWEEALHSAYLSGDLQGVKTALEGRERHGLPVFKDWTHKPA